jgi:methyltransferase-like protein/ubiquinone/menaquinone biosynthesis C-methylase UbiE
MNEVLGTSYDEVLYESQALYSTHPDCLRTAARLRGIAAPPAGSCRVLELGCGTGGNLIPMAYGLRESRFVGIDLSARQVEIGQALCHRLNLSNIDLRPTSITDVDASWGKFDYIICHGVFSWVPQSVQDHILWICRQLLTPRGVAYISYNTYPGWHLRNVVRNLMRYHTCRFDDPESKVEQARLILNFMAKASASFDSPMSKVLAKEAEMLPDEPDYYLFHEHLEENNAPLYFHEFVARARAAGLEYLGEAWHHMQMDNLAPDVRETLQNISNDLIEMEQFLDYLRCRTFRRTLLCHAETPIVRTPEPEVMAPMYFTSLVHPLSEQPDVVSPSEEQFQLDNGSTAKTNNPLLKAALVELCRQWPRAVPFDELLAAAVRDSQWADEEKSAAQTALAALLMRSYAHLLVAVQSQPFPFSREVSVRPKASALARLQAAERARVTNLRHRIGDLAEIDRVVLRLADGTRTASEIAELAASSEAWDGAAANGDQPTKIVEQALRRLARAALLEA